MRGISWKSPESKTHSWNTWVPVRLLGSEEIQLRERLVEIPLFIGFQHHPRWLFEISAINSTYIIWWQFLSQPDLDFRFCRNKGNINFQRRITQIIQPFRLSFEVLPSRPKWMWSESPCSPSAMITTRIACNIEQVMRDKRSNGWKEAFCHKKCPTDSLHVCSFLLPFVLHQRVRGISQNGLQFNW